MTIYVNAGRFAKPFWIRVFTFTHVFTEINKGEM